MIFSAFNLEPKLLEGLDAMGFNKPTPIQELAIPIILQNKDLIACAQTGTGKTAAYLLPILNKIISTETRHLNTLVLSPTRELAVQIDQQVEGFGYFLDVSSISIYGGGSGEAWDKQKKALLQGADIIIATPGRLIALLAAGDINLSHLQHLVLDEADRMLDMGFYDDLIKIINYLPVNRQTLMFSATMPPKIRTLANKILKHPEQINIALSQPAEGILQQAYVVYDTQKLPLLKSILQNELYASIIIFASTKDKVKELDKEFRNSKLSIRAFHSDLEQEEREIILREFKNKQIAILIGTDIISRGIDVEGISLVVNFDVPPDPEDYIHRIGRTARAATTGTAITFINDKDQKKFARIEAHIGREIEKVALPEALGEGPVYNPAAQKNISEKRPFNKKKTWKPRK